MLDAHVADQIAAGEVVERPASVLKELVENALDAGARRIVCDIIGGGSAEIAVRDDGCGMSPDDVRLALKRHATSKIAQIEDLQRLATLGFRGEALPSIASVSQLELTSRTRDRVGAWLVRLDGGHPVEDRAVGAPPGTTVSVRRLFFNTPARAAGLKTPQGEAAACARLLEPIALGHADVAVQLRIDGRPSLQTQGSGRLLDVLAAVYGPDFARSCLPLSYEREGVRVEGAAGLPALARGTRRFQTIVVNGHAVGSASIRAAAEQAYRGSIPERRFPAFVLLVTVDPATVDVNVHPRKSEVRFANERRVAGTVHRAIREALRSADLTPDLGQLDDAHPSARQSGDRSWPFAHRDVGENAVAEAMRLYMPEGADGPRESRPVGEGRFPSLRVLGVHADLFIVASGPDGLYVLDQHAAHEKIQYERILAGKPEACAAQWLAAPIVVELPPDRMAAWEEWQTVLTENGLLVEPFGRAAVAVRAVPAAFSTNPELAVRDFLERLLGEEQRAFQSDEEGGASRHRAFARAACRSSVRAGERLAPAEREALIDELRALDDPFTCPHGRPTIWKIPTKDMEHRFGRR